MPFGIDPNAIAPSPGLERQTMLQRREMAAGERARANQTVLAQAELAANRAARAAAGAFQQQQFQAAQEASARQDVLVREQIGRQAALEDSKMRLEQAKIAKAALLEDMGITAAERAATAQHKFLEAQADLDRVAQRELVTARLTAEQDAVKAAQQFQMEELLPAEQAFRAGENAADRAARLEQERIQQEAMGTRAGATSEVVSARELELERVKQEREAKQQEREDRRNAMKDANEAMVNSELKAGSAEWITERNRLYQSNLSAMTEEPAATPSPTGEGGTQQSPPATWDERVFTTIVENGKQRYAQNPTPAILDGLMADANKKYGTLITPQFRDMLAQAIGVSITDPNDPAWKYRMEQNRSGRGGGTRRPSETLFGPYLTPGMTPGRNSRPLFGQGR